MHDVRHLLHPLDEFYAESGLPLPAAERVVDTAIPSPQRALLAHGDLMTPVLERHYGRAIRLHVLRARATGTAYARQVVLLLDGSAEAVAFGAVKLDLSRFAPALRQDVLAAERPLGRIVRDRGGVYGVRPRAFVRVTPDAVIAGALGCAGAPALYGRRSALVDGAGNTFAEIVEILALRD